MFRQNNIIAPNSIGYFIAEHQRKWQEKINIRRPSFWISFICLEIEVFVICVWFCSHKLIKEQEQEDEKEEKQQIK